MTETLTPRVLVVGGGPGGYVAAIRCGQLGLTTVLVETDRLGGTCLIRGCIPSKALIHASSDYAAMLEKLGKGHLGIRLSVAPTIDFAETIQWKNGIVATLNSGVAALLKRANVRVVKGWAEFSDAKTCIVRSDQGAVRIEAEHVVLATGSHAASLAGLPFGGDVIASTEALDLTRLPEHLAIVGAGYIGLELGTAFRKLGTKITVLEYQDRILPQYDEELTAPVRNWLDRAGVRVELNAEVIGFKDGALLFRQRGKDAAVHADKVLVTVGRVPRTEGWGLEKMAVDKAGRFVQVDDRCHTSMRNVWAIGDLVGEPMLAHKASAQGEMVAEIIAGRKRRFDPAAIPAVCFTEPEIVAVGLQPQDSKEVSGDTVVGRFPFAANGRSLSMDAGNGFVRIVARKSDSRVLGIQAVGAHASELSGEFSHSIEMGATLEDVAGTIHAHPTLSEAFQEAALRALGHAIHI